jgi:hypothetical protein
MEIKDLKKLLREGRKFKTIYILSSYQIMSHPDVFTIVIIPLHVRNNWVDVEILASEEHLRNYETSPWGLRLFGRVVYGQFTIFREWTPEDAPLTINFKVISKNYKKIAFGT